MRNIIGTVTIAAAAAILAVPAFAGPAIQVPEPVSLSLLASGIAVIAAVKRLRRK
jgi:hypothetical protein